MSEWLRDSYIYPIQKMEIIPILNIGLKGYWKLPAGKNGQPLPVANEKAVRAGIEPASLNIGGARFGANVTTISAKNDTNENSPTIRRPDEN